MLPQPWDAHFLLPALLLLQSFSISVITIFILVCAFVFVVMVAIVGPPRAENHVHHGRRLKIVPDSFARINYVGFVLHIAKTRSL